MGDDAPQAASDFSDLFATDRKLIYTPGRPTPGPRPIGLRETMRNCAIIWHDWRVAPACYSPHYPAHLIDFL